MQNRDCKENCREDEWKEIEDIEAVLYCCSGLDIYWDSITVPLTTLTQARIYSIPFRTHQGQIRPILFCDFCHKAVLNGRIKPKSWPGR